MAPHGLNGHNRPSPRTDATSNAGTSHTSTSLTITSRFGKLYDAQPLAFAPVDSATFRDLSSSTGLPSSTILSQTFPPRQLEGRAEDRFPTRHALSGPIERSTAFLPLSYTQESGVSRPFEKFLPSAAAPFSPVSFDAGNHRQTPVTNTSFLKPSRLQATHQAAMSGPITRSIYRNAAAASANPSKPTKNAVTTFLSRSVSGPISPAACNAIPHSYLSGPIRSPIAEAAAPSGWELPGRHVAHQATPQQPQVPTRRVRFAEEEIPLPAKANPISTSSCGSRGSSSSNINIFTTSSDGDSESSVLVRRASRLCRQISQDHQQANQGLSVNVPRRWYGRASAGESGTPGLGGLVEGSPIAFALPPPPLASASPTC